METILETNDLTFGFDHHKALFSNLNLKIQKGSWVGIIGPNGAGKTTLINLLLGLYEPSKGCVSLHLDRQKIGYVPQLNHFQEDLPLSALDVVLMGSLFKLDLFGRYPKAAQKKALTLLESLDLIGFASQPFCTLSGGQKKRVLIARALMNDPELLILDEPTSGVDSESKEKMYAILDSLGTTILQVTHEIETIINKVDLVLSLGENVQLLKPQEICEHFAKGLYHNPLIESNC